MQKWSTMCMTTRASIRLEIVTIVELDDYYFMTN